MGDRRSSYRVLVGKPEGRRTLGRPGHRWKDNIKKDIQAVKWGGKDWVHLAQDTGRWQALAN
jgi:hypothetical protein